MPLLTPMKLLSSPKVYSMWDLVKVSSAVPTKAEQERIWKLVEDVSKALEGHSFEDIYHICTAALAANDVLSGRPNFTLTQGFTQIHGQVQYFSAIAREYMVTHNRLPTMLDILAVYTGEESAQPRQARVAKLN